MISIVIPLYNKEPYVLETLQSVVNQTFQSFEVIVVDDGSTDNSVAVAKKINDPRICIIERENEGVSVARNVGIEHARFDWVAFLDADDWWASNFLEAFVKALNDFPEEKIFAGGRSRVFKNETERYAHPYLPKDGSVGKVNYFQVISKYLPPINSSNVVMAKSLLKEHRFRPGMKQHEDHDLWIRICAQHEVVFINEPLSFYRKDLQNSGSASGFSFTDFLNYLKDIKTVSEILSSEEKNFFKRYYNRFVPIRYFQSYYQYSETQRKEFYTYCKGLLSKKSICIVRGLNIFSFVNVYSIFKKLKG
ncbi:MAG: glycosyl transferase [Alteromonas sp.]|nr:glycosyl transferase [Alteromonas sp.]